MRTPLLPGLRAWIPQNEAPSFIPERTPALHFSYRRWPAAIRVLADGVIHTAPLMDEETVWKTVRFLIDPARRPRPTAVKLTGDEPQGVRPFLEWLRWVELKRLRSWWTSPYGWKSPREPKGFANILEELRFPALEPFEIAQFRIPDDISTDPDVVLFVARCQGVIEKYIPDDSCLRDSMVSAVKAGMRKFCASPWVKLAVAAPFMQPIGVLFPNAGYLECCERMGYLLRHPYTATDAELDVILASVVFDSAFKRARRARARGRFVNPDGHWYPAGSMNGALGAKFRRGQNRDYIRE